MGTRIWLALVVAACGAGSDPSWIGVRQHEPAALLSVWGASTHDVWVVGARTELAGGPTVAHYDGAAWTRLDPHVADLDLWWVFGFAGGDVLFGGTDGTILRYRDGTFEKMPTPRTGTIFGIWGASPADVWAVGDGGAAGGIVWHYDGTQWTEPALPPGTPGRVFKVHGQATDDVWISCSDGSTLHWQGTALEREVTGVSAPLFSIVTTPERVIAVGGGDASGTIAERDTAWATSAFQLPAAWRGAAAGGGEAYAVGQFGAVARRDDAGWSRIDQPLTQTSFHAAWVDPAGGLWGVGGEFDTLPLTSDGFLLYYGTEPIGELSP